ncbi:uncharacterized protein F5Z01DRAFT_168252 [Emericellopsis atlantica]|uniref:Transcription factor domain-containing protein n=1 Tax=Emericellopsis atlantica TaxID=2614577 RepID=A0A9P7ZJ83_9HYPO|nr:uncharacterized protein F5Z01DRAFT_168252 [Emericellopsis atlantica]KAG9252926.1 hypothetical protein F5Z01DRAFT_168252 [Emericellopsis atlantica]
MSNPLAHQRADSDYNAIVVDANVSFALIAARIQDRMAELPLTTPAELKKLDEELLDWRANINPILNNGRHSPEPVRLACIVLGLRYLNQRMTLHRPFLLLQTIKASTEGNMVSQDADRIADTCCAIAQETINTIADNWYPNQLLGWNCTWFLFQACLVILLKLLSKTAGADSQILEVCVVQCLELLTEMRPWRRSAAQTHDLLLFIFNARTASTQDWGANCSLSDEALLNLLGFGPIDGDVDWSQILDYNEQAPCGDLMDGSSSYLG